MPVEEVTLSAKIFDFLEAGLKWQPAVDKPDEIDTLLGAMEQHRAIYEDLLFEIVGKTASSIKELRLQLQAMRPTDGFAREAEGLIQLACADFLSKAEALSLQSGMPSSQAIFADDVRIQDLPPDLSYQFAVALGEFRHAVIIVLDAIQKRGKILPPGLERLIVAPTNPASTR